MTTISLVTPIQYIQITNLKFTDYILLFKDKNEKLKRAIPDFEARFMDYENSLINEALEADKVSVFRVVRRGKTSCEPNPVFYISVNEHGEVINHNTFGEHEVNLENLLLDSERRQTISKLLKKRR